MQKERGGRIKERIIVAVVAILVLGGIMVGAYYREEVSLYMHLQPWDQRSAEKLVRDFVRNAHAGDAAAANALDGKRAKPVTSGGKLTGISYMGERGPGRVAIKDFVPTPDVKQMETRIRPIAKLYGIAVEYSNGRWAEFAVDRTPAGFRIVNVSGILGDRKLSQLD
jgi:hypothetical protein